MTSPNDSAFPVFNGLVSHEADFPDYYPEGGLSKRELLAAMAMNGMMACGPILGEADPSIGGKVSHCVRLADALLAELSKTEKEHG